jgi:hypothetical protein
MLNAMALSNGEAVALKTSMDSATIRSVAAAMPSERLTNKAR